MKPSQLENVLPKLMEYGKPVLIAGPPGVGKTDIIIKCSTVTLGYDIIICHPVVDAPIDYKGLPYAFDGKAYFIPYGHLLQMIEADRPTVVFFDDLGQAPDAVQAAVMQLLLQREINGKKISDNIRFVAATNRKSDKAAVSGILEPVKSRFITIINLDPDAEDWLSWAEKNNMPVELMAYVTINPDVVLSFKPCFEIENSPCPRTLANLGELYNLGFDPESSTELFIGAIGKEEALKFVSFDEVYKRAPRLKDIINDPETTPVPDETDFSIRAIVCSSLIAIANHSNFDSIIKYVSRMSREYGQFVLSAVTDGNPSLKETKTYNDFIIKNQSYLK